MASVPKVQMNLWMLLGSLQEQQGSTESRSSNSRSMNSSLWSRLPKEVLEKVLMQLPPVTQFRLRAVSKEWRARLSSVEFLRLSASSSAPSSAPPMLCGLDHRILLGNETSDTLADINVEDAARCTIWKNHELDLSFLPAELYDSPWDLDHYLCADGLWYYNYRKSNEVGTCVLNPMTRTWRILPKLLLENLWIAAEDTHLKLEVVNKCNENLQLEFTVRYAFYDTGTGRLLVFVYSSLSDDWKCIPMVDTIPTSKATIWVALYFCCGMLYLFHDRGQFVTTHSLEDGKLLRTGSLEFPWPSIVSPDKWGTDALELELSVLELDDREIFGVTSFHEEVQTQIWKLDHSTLAWERFSTMPKGLHESLVESAGKVNGRFPDLSQLNDAVGEFITLRFCFEYPESSSTNCVCHTNNCNNNHDENSEARTSSTTASHPIDCALFSDLRHSCHRIACHVPTGRWHVVYENVGQCEAFLDDTFLPFVPRLDLFL
ncbi:hypothetical protein MPTK1_2g07520 [Marchantia polymorpha subsp. ruderalis]|uniref:F-box domain-containing protein n=1 Tax=Marchantia polymorpha TaxID=3197 RepID=A0A2R6XGJ1_MARPO|nr:hypothetical protein MARPO_0015s0038 [Marchantia polymorpha]BBN01455.1 hypothetical protein Mp_2g07520 [Marchantia polymorpha subsp. ruderalis]|eukprot:PTQ45222.1 hypothetical protein MARPO_0015s0038 [Marchantia polymorpha]